VADLQLLSKHSSSADQNAIKVRSRPWLSHNMNMWNFFQDAVLLA